MPHYRRKEVKMASKLQLISLFLTLSHLDESNAFISPVSIKQRIAGSSKRSTVEDVTPAVTSRDYSSLSSPDILNDVENDLAASIAEGIDGFPSAPEKEGDLFRLKSTVEDIEVVMKASQEAALVAEASMGNVVDTSDEVSPKSKVDFPSVKRILMFATSATGVFLCSPLLSLIDTSSVGLLSGTAQQAALNPAVAVTDYAALLMVINTPYMFLLF